MSAKQIQFEKLVSMDWPLGMIELHCELEGPEKTVWTDKRFDFRPLTIAKYDGKQAHLYYDPLGMEWLRNEAGNNLNDEVAVEKVKEYFDIIKDTIEKETALSREDLIVFIDNVKKFWPWIAYLWWRIEYKEKHGMSVDVLMTGRKYTEYFIPGLAAVWRNSVRRIHPDLAQYTDALLYSEVLSNSIPDQETLQKRSAGYVYANDRLYDSWGDLGKDFDIVVKTEAPTTKGQIAYPGLVKGKVKIISSREDMHSFEEGNVLVASTTTPDFLPAMKKSAAILSEHGGVICHAAITSRELKIPCIVGLKGITKTLKNGDMVEVDANTGIVRIL